MRPSVAYRRERLDGGWTIIHVLLGLEIVGRIVRAPGEGKYRFFEGHDNHLAYTHESADLTALQRKIEADFAQRPL